MRKVGPFVAAFALALVVGIAAALGEWSETAVYAVTVVSVVLLAGVGTPIALTVRREATNVELTADLAPIAGIAAAAAGPVAAAGTPVVEELEQRTWDEDEVANRRGEPIGPQANAGD